MKIKYKQKERTEEEYLKEVEKVNYETALEARKTLDAIGRTTERTTNTLREQREKLEEIKSETDVIADNIEKGKELSVKMKRAGKLITIGDKIEDKIKSVFRALKDDKKDTSTVRKHTKQEEYTVPDIPETEESPTEESTNKVLQSIRNGLQDLKERLIVQNKEIVEQVPLIQDITKTNKAATTEACKVMKNLKK